MPSTVLPRPTDARLHRRRSILAAVALTLTVGVVSGCGAEASSDARGTDVTTTTVAPTTTVDDPTTTTDPIDPPCAIEDLRAGTPVTAVDPGCIPEPEPVTTTTIDDPEPDPGPSGGERAYVEALAIGLVALDEDDLPVTEDEADCIAPEWVDQVGVDDLAANDVGPEDLEAFELDEVFADAIDRTDADRMVAAVEGCGIDLEAFVRQDGLSSGEATEAQMDCFFAALPDGAIQDVLAVALDEGDDLTIDDPAVTALSKAYAGCMGDTTTTGG